MGIKQVNTTAPQRRSAGRNLKAAIPVGFAMGAVVLVALLAGPWGWYPLVAALVALATWEVVFQLQAAGYLVARWWLLIAGQCMVWITIPLGANGAGAVFAGASLITMLVHLFMQPKATAEQRFLRDTAVSIFILSWIPLLGSFAAQISLIQTDTVAARYFIMAFILCVVASDTGGYIAGVLFGKHPMAPAISPKKSWEGFAGSVSAAMLVGAIFSSLVLELPWWAGCILGVVLAICATLGDLVESQFKRDLGIKDMSNMLPGHGGLMDRLDGMLPAAMITWVVLTFALM
ncbi:phosphatidate cytidylyltransferase [Corynebacterium caspium]|uniref:phosphatidate cytidylyltransferase n=1 Tax=Corynebacterium caspium TaxID=234828 RepID=UPI00035F1ABD|nr:phosphatidate cytidylyltransferase [Corynebacterium caspium]WKD59071.1 Phosphatidate cytidylyltransferase [Corynebacterium caspium DSM 44850]